MTKDNINGAFKTRSQEVAELRNRVEAAFPFLPKNYKKIIAERYPAYNTIEGGAKINNVIAGRSTNEDITKIIELIATEHGFVRE
jgi:hypothetical protein